MEVSVWSLKDLSHLAIRISKNLIGWSNFCDYIEQVFRHRHMIKVLLAYTIPQMGTIPGVGGFFRDFCIRVWHFEIWNPNHVGAEKIASCAIISSLCKTDYPVRVLSIYVAAYHKQKSSRSQPSKNSASLRGSKTFIGWAQTMFNCLNTSYFG